MESSAPIRPYGRLANAALSTRSCARLWVWLAWLLALGYGVAPVLAQEQAAAEQDQQPPAAETPVTPQTLSDQVAKLEAELAAQRAEIEQLKAAGSQSSGAELAAMISQSEQGGSSETIEEPLLRAYGFADVGLQRMWADPEIAGFISESDKTTFVLGNLNVYLDAQPSSDIRLLAEVRFGLSPNGAVTRPQGGLSTGSAVDTTVTDPSAANSGFTAIRWAGVIPQRAHIDWTPSDAFNIRMGLFLNPYGIWNVDHGTPTRIMVSEPLFLSAQLIPNQLLGIEVYGTTQLLPWTIGYHLHVSNGRTLGQIDFSDSKAIGGRVFASTRFPHAFKIGISGYKGDSETVPEVAFSRQSAVALDEYAFSADLSLDIGRLRIRSEFVASMVRYEQGKRPLLFGLPTADAMRIGTYLLLAYQLPWYGIEPLLMCEFLRVPIPRVIPVGEGIFLPAVGLNVYFTPTTMLRTQFAIAHGFDFGADAITPKGYAYQAVSRLITAF
jgi:hypothetical protein